MVAKLFESIFSLELSSVILIILGLFILNILFYFLVRKLVTKKFKTTNSPEISLYLERNLIKYFGSVLLLICSFFITLMILPHIDFIEKLTFFIALVLVYTFIILLLICQNLILFDINKEMRGTTITKKEQILNLVKILIFTIIPIILFLTLLDLKPYEKFVQGDMQQYVAIIYPLMLYILICLLMLPLRKFIIKGKAFEDKEIYQELYSFIEASGIKDFKLYTWPTKNTKHANALVSGIKNKEVYVSDYLLENFTLDETKGIISHEIGHIKKRHILQRSLYNLALFIIVPLVGYGMNKFQDYYYDIPAFTGIIVMVFIIVFYIFLLRYFIYRKQEKEADLYVLELGIEKDVYVSALIKLSKLNHGMMKQNKIDEKFQTHPSIARRIDAILKG